MSTDNPRVAILGAGPAGASAAWSLSGRSRAQVTVFEQRDTVGGNAGSFNLEGVWCDHGSHRLHPAADARVLDEVRSILDKDLLWRPRHGRILLQDRWIHFPLKPIDLILRCPKRFVATLAMDSLMKLIPRRAAGEDNFATVLERGLGPTICNAFYFPYVQKLWGLRPADLAVTLAKRRVSGNSVSKIVRRILQQVPGFGSSTSGGFYYPRKGFGQISRGLHDAAVSRGARFSFDSRIEGIIRNGNRVTGVRYSKDGQSYNESFDAVWSTLPITLLAGMMQPGPPAEVIEAAGEIRFRGMVLIYLVLEQSQFTEYDAHYFPELSIPISRLSEPKNYSGVTEPSNRTVLCAELPSDPGDETWSLTDEQLGEHLRGWLSGVGLPVTARVNKVVIRRLRFAYPVYDRNYEEHLRVVDKWLSNINGLLTFGRQGLFAHDNTHHAMTMAFAATDCFGAHGDFDRVRWSTYREEFEEHVVED